jgi:hypothetical protein
MWVESRITDRLTQLGYVPQTAAIAYDTFIRSLRPEETILYLLEGGIKNTLGFIVATDKRVYYVGINKFKDPFLELIDYKQIDEIHLSDTRWPSSYIRLVTNHEEKEIIIKGCEPVPASEFVELIRLLVFPPKG